MPPVRGLSTVAPGIYDLADYLTTDEMAKGNVNALPAFQYALADIGSNGGLLVVPPGRYYLSQNVTIPDSVDVIVLAGASIVGPGSLVIRGESFNGPVRAFGNMLIYPSGGVSLLGGLGVGDPGAQNFSANIVNAYFRVSTPGLRISADIGGSVAGTITITNAKGIGNGAITNLTAPALGTGTGPSSLTVAAWLKVYDGTTVRWIPMFS
jgi:hypothetical protein